MKAIILTISSGLIILLLIVSQNMPVEREKVITEKTLETSRPFSDKINIDILKEIYKLNEEQKNSPFSLEQKEPAI